VWGRRFRLPTGFLTLLALRIVAPRVSQGTCKNVDYAQSCKNDPERGVDQRSPGLGSERRRSAPSDAPRAIYFDTEGHVIRYNVTFPATNKAVFESDGTQPGPRFRLSYWLDSSTLNGKFEVAPSGADYKTITCANAPFRSRLGNTLKRRSIFPSRARKQAFRCHFFTDPHSHARGYLIHGSVSAAW
jgi:hypothetical protein